MQNTRSQEAAGPREAPLSTLRVMDILSALATSPKGIKLRELSEMLDIPKSSLLSLLRGLIKGQYVRQTESGYVLGEETLRFCAKAYQSNSLPERARPVLEMLAEQTGETIALAVLAEDRRSLVYIDVLESPSVLRFAPKKGDMRPLYSTSPGQVLLAFFGEEELQEYFSTVEFKRFTPNTLTRSQLRRRLEEIQRNGYTLNFDGMTRGVSSAAAAVFDGGGKLACVLSAAGPAERFGESEEAIVAATCNAAGEISRMLGFTDGAANTHPPRTNGASFKNSSHRLNEVISTSPT